MTDVAPGLLAKIEKRYRALKAEVNRLKVIEDILPEVASYKEVHEYALILGEILAESFSLIDATDLPDGRMYKNIARKLLNPTLEANYRSVTKLAVKTQETLNRRSGIRLKAVEAGINTDKINGLVEKLASADDFNDVSWLLNEPIVNFTQSVVDDTIKVNAEFQYKSGLRPRIVRTATSDCCDWCSDLVGTYDYPETPLDIYRRHRNCKCLVEYQATRGVRQNVWTKKHRLIPEVEEGFSNTEAAPFSRKIKKAKKSLPKDISWRVTPYDPDGYVGMKLHTTPQGSTVAVTQDGDIVSVCKALGDPTSGRELIAEAVKNGGVKLDSYDGNHGFYQKCGFEPVSWCKWIDDFAPSDWQEAYGREDIVFYIYTGKVPEELEFISDFYKRVPASASYDEAMSLRDKLLEEVKNK